jgi:anaerobic selenocysteine-containing dehydrogenase
VTPNHNLVVKGLQRKDLFTVVHEQFFTDTTDYADIVLPATTFFEHKDLVQSYGHYYLQMSNQAIQPLGECKSNVDLFRALAERMGLTDDYLTESDDSMIDQALASGSPRLQGIDRQRLEKEGHARLNFSGTSPDAADAKPFLPFAEGNFTTPSGKAEFYSEQLKIAGLDPVAAFEPPEESRHTAAAKKFPLELLSRKADNFLNSSFCNTPTVAVMEDTGLLEIAPADASARGIRHGDSVRAFNDRGDLVLRAHVNGSVQPGTVASHLNWAKLSAGGKNINALTSEKLTDLGNSATFYSVLVEVELLQTVS